MDNGTAPELTESYGEASDVQHVAEELAVHSVISEERHEEILEETNNVCKRLDQLSEVMKTSNENLTAALTSEVIALKSELVALKSELVSLKQSQAIRQSNPSPGLGEPKPPTSPSDAAGHPELRTEEPPPSPAPPLPKKRRRI